MSRFAAMTLLLCACYSKQIDPIEEQPKLLPFGDSSFFEDHSAMRAPPAGTVPRERRLDESAPPLSWALLSTGRDRFNILCGACHGLAGDGDSIVAGKMSLKPPPSLYEPRIVALSDDRLYQIVRDGYGLMPRYSDRLDVTQRWAVVDYVRALQLSRHVGVAALPDDLRRKLEAMP